MGGGIIQELDNQLKRYLLGELEESDEEQLELRLLTDPEFARQLDLTVDEIIDQYVLGKLPEPDRDRVQNHFLKSEERQAKLRFALALKERKSRRTSNKQSTTRQFTPYLAVAASVLAILGIGFAAYRALQSEPDLNEGLVALQSAYREERPVEGRVSDFSYVPLPNQRGGASRVDQRQRDLAAALLLKALRDRPTAATHQAAGKYYLMNHQFEQARSEFTAALELEPNNAKIHSDLGAAFLEEARLQSAAPDNSKQLELYGQSLEELQKALELDKSLTEALFNRALVYQLMKPSEQAIQAWNAYLAVDSTSQWADEARRNIELIKQQLGASTEKKDNLKEFVDAFRRKDDEAARKVLSITYTSAGNEITNRLIDSFVGIEPFQETLDPPGTLAALTYLAKLESDHAKDRYTSDLLTHYQLATTSPTKSILAKARQHLRTAYSSFEKSRFREAIQEYSKAKTRFEEANDLVGKAFVEFRMAHCYALLLDPERARLAYSQLLAFSEANQYQWLAAQCLFGLAFASADNSEYSKAIEYSSQALARFEQTGDLNGTIKCLTQLADLNQAVNQIATALGYLSRTLRLMDHVSSQPMQTWTIFNQIGFSMTSLQLHTAALFYQKEALRIALDAGIPLIISRSYGYVGSAYAAMKMYAEAVTEATAALEMAQGMTSSPEAIEYIAHASKQLGDIYREAGKCNSAINFYDQSLQHYKQLDSDLYAYVAHKGKLHCFIQTANGVAASEELRTVFGLSEVYRSKITVESQRNSFFDAEQGVYDLAIGYQFGAQDYVKALEYSEQSRARSLLDAVQQGNENRVRKSGVVTPSLTVAEIQNRMPSNSQIVQYAVLDDKVLIWVVTSTDVKYADVPIPLSVLTEKINAFLDTINHPPVADAKQDHGSELYDLLIRPVKDYLDRSRVLIIVPDKLLNYLPFAALKSSPAHYLTEDYDLAIAPSGTLFANLSAAAERKNGVREERLLSVGDPRFDRGQFKSLRDLPASVGEATTVAGLYVNPQRLLRDEARESTITSELENVDVAHLAMHFIVNEQSELLSGFPLTPEALERSGTARYNGFLQSQEIYRLNLSRMRLAILSACQTGIERQYRGEGAVGAARPFFVAGVPTVVASLWPVDSDASAKLMVNFHRHRRDPLPVIQALKKAQVEMIQGADVRFRHPYYWAPFVAIGGLTNY